LSSAALAQAPTDSATELAPLQVTGSRLQADTTAAVPVSRFNAADLQRSGASTVGAFLQSLPQMIGAPNGSSVGARGSGGGFSRGIETVDMRGLGARRTLILLDGRRFIAGGNGSEGIVDLGSIPLDWVERIEVLATGASVEYGADAVSGVVNIITRRRAEGLSLSTHWGQSERGDGEQGRLALRLGQNLGQGQWLLGAEFFRQQPLGKGERDWSREQLGVEGENNAVFASGISSAPPQGNFRTSNGRLTLIAGEDGDRPEDFRPFVGDGPGNDRYNYNPFEDLLQEAERSSLYGTVEQTLGAGLRLFARGLFQRRESRTTLAPLPFFTNRLEGVSVAADNLYNPFDEELSDVRRRLVEGGSRAFLQDSQLWRLDLGLEGDWGDWRWNAQIAQARNRVDQTQSGDLLRDRVALALGPSFRDGSGQARCGSAEAPIAECVPLNLFGGPGSISQEMLDYAGIAPLKDRFENEQSLLNLDIHGPLMELPAGPLQAAFGLELREEEAQDIPDPQTQAGNTTGAARNPTRGRFDAQELYAEFGLPLLLRSDGGRLLELDLGLRGLRYSNFSTRSVGDLGLSLQPSPDWALRLRLAQAYRAPSVGELFGGATQTNPAVNDPCADFSSLNSAQQQRCVDQGVPADGSFDENGNEAPLIGGGNPDLEPETAEIFSAGLSWSPRALPGLGLRLDYYAIDIEEAIASLSADTVLQQCLDSGDAAVCGQIERNADGSIAQIRSPLRNIAADKARGLDLEARYAHGLSQGRLRHRLLLSHLLRREVQAFAGAPVLAAEGQFAPDFGSIPRWKGAYSVDWQAGALGLNYALQWIDGLRESGGELFPGSSRRIGSRVYHDLSLRWEALQGWSLEASIRNLSDRDPPLVINGDDANTDVASYRLLGRSYGLSLGWDF
ncbi:MAG: TonB-dependent receptor domain-containing protein, partial [Oceanococcaceae bacterium]